MYSLVNQEIFRNALKTNRFLIILSQSSLLANKNIILSKKINQETNLLILLTDKAPQMNLNCKSILQNFKDAGTNATNRVFIS